jgi:deoxynucleoside triphosphate triphosphohydrolase SAMHD1
MTNDVIYGEVCLDQACAHIVNCPSFQRLRNLQQLGLTSWVFPSATHDRFAHSLGVAHLAGKYAAYLGEWYSPGEGREANINKRDILRLQVAGTMGIHPY